MTTPKDASFPKMYFNGLEYAARYEDVGTNGIPPSTHFARVGHAEGRVPSDALAPLAGALRLRADSSPTPLGDVVALLPHQRRRALNKGWFWDRLRAAVHPEFYAHQAGLSLDITPEQTLDHFLGWGAFEGLRVSMFFNSRWYTEQWQEHAGDPFPDDGHPFFHWLTEGWEARIVPTPLFDEEYYLARHRDMARWRSWPFEHYLLHGAYELQRKSSAFVGKPEIGDPEAKAERRPLLLRRLLESVDGHELAFTSGLEEDAFLLAAKVARLQSPEMASLVEKAYNIEPLIKRPYGPREVNWPPLANSAVLLRDHAQRARESLPSTHFDTIVLAPHCRMAGSARVTGALVAALDDLAKDDSILVLTTDLPDFDRPDWFPPGINICDVSSVMGGLSEEQQTRVLLDVVRGLTPKRVVNVNSRRAWELFRMFGRQLSDVMEVNAYLFTWDLDLHGNKGGYPITYFQDCLDYLHRVFVDSQVLFEELVWRYAMPQQMRDRLRVLHTPADYPPDVDHSAVFERRRAKGEPLRAFWSGRFDRQKRFDVVVDLARLMPELEIWAWGKPVLGGLDVDFDNLPDNVTLKGTYRHFEDLPVEDCDFFLYTSEWDGLPTILIDAGARGVATVASAVGGVVDIVNEETAFPVMDALDANAYSDRIRDMVADPHEVARRASRFREDVRVTCSAEGYRSALGEALRIGATSVRLDDLAGDRVRA